MSFPSLPSPFGVTHPLGLPRPIERDNFFGAQARFFAANLMPVPTGCLAHFDEAVYRPHTAVIAGLLAGLEPGWGRLEVVGDPPRYCLLRDGFPCEVPSKFQPLLPEPPRVRLEAVLEHFSRCRKVAPPLQLLDILTLVAEDLGPARFASATAGHPWVAEYLR